MENNGYRYFLNFDNKNIVSLLVLSTYKTQWILEPIFKLKSATYTRVYTVIELTTPSYTTNQYTQSYIDILFSLVLKVPCSNVTSIIAMCFYMQKSKF